jgi:all-trans-retinol 13,14-reductase
MDDERAEQARRRAEEKQHLPTSQTAARSKSPLPESVDVAIIGAGTGGLCAGAYLARAGIKVAVFDFHYVAGGNATRFARGSSDSRYMFDIGLHYVGDCGPGGITDRVLAPLDLGIEWLEMDPDGFDTLVFPDFTFRIPADVNVFRQRLLDLFPEERAGIERYLRLVRELSTMGPKIFDSHGRIGPKELWHVATRGRLLAWHQNSTAKKFLDTCTSNPKLRAVLLGQHGDYGLPPSEVSALLQAGLANHYFGGAYYPKGGGQIVSDRMAEAIEAAGGTVHLRTGIEKVLIEDGKAVGVRTESRGDVRAKVVLSNADIKKTFLDLVGPDHLPRKYIRRSEAWEMPTPIFSTYLGVKADLGELGMTTSNTWQFDDYDTEAYYKSARDVDNPMPRGCYITSASMKDPGDHWHAPKDVSTVEVMALLPGDARAWGVSPQAMADGSYSKDPAYIDRKKAIEDDLVRRFDEQFPGGGQSVVFRESATPASHGRFTRASGGTGYGLSAIPSQFNEGRPGVKTPIEDLYICGASTRSGHGILGALLSGRIAASSIRKRLKP